MGLGLELDYDGPHADNAMFTNPRRIKVTAEGLAIQELAGLRHNGSV